MNHTRFLAPITALTLLALAGGCASKSAPVAVEPLPTTISGRYIATLVDGQAVAAEKGLDALTLISLPISDAAEGTGQWQTPFAQLPLPNALSGQPGSLDVNPAGSAAYAVSNKGNGLQALIDGGDSVVSIDLAEAMSPKLSGTALAGLSPRSLAVSPAGDVLAVTLAKADQPLALVKVNGAQFGDAATWSPADLGIQAGDPAWNVSWHPSGKFLAVVLPKSSSVAFFEVDRSNGGLALATWGSPVQLPDSGQSAQFGRFSPDGNTFILVSAGASAAKGVDAAAPGAITAIRFAATGEVITTSDGKATMNAPHSIAGQAVVGVGPQGFAFAGDGKHLVVASARGSAGGGALTVLHLASDGGIRDLGTTPAGGLPFGVAFDSTGSTVIVSRVSETPGSGEGELAFFGLGADGSLTKSKITVGVGKGPHGTLIAH